MLKMHPELQQMLDEVESRPPREDWLVHRSDAIEYLKSQNSGSAHLLITDPPYSSLEKHRAVGTTTRLTREWFDVVDDDYFRPLFLEMYRVLHRAGHFYCFCDQSTLPAVQDAAAFAGFKWHKFLVWDKTSIGMGYHYRAQHELIAFCSKSGASRTLQDRSIGDVLSFPRVYNGYPTEKPVDLLKVLVTQSSSHGQIVMDPFAGSGSTGEAALSLGRLFRGCDTSQDAVDEMHRRLTGVAR